MSTASSGIRIAMWSGPRTISTALMRAWENRGDTAVCDEPFYAHYLQATGLPHPGRDEVIASQETNWARVVALLTGPAPGGRAIFYQKHMAHHLLPHIGRTWLEQVANCFLIRDPREMLTSLAKTTPAVRLSDTGFPQQWEIFEFVRTRSGSVPPVIDARDVLENPEGMLRRLCSALGVPFQREMLAWPPGRRETDGVWARYWYAAVEASTGFQPYRQKAEPLPEQLREVYDACRSYYDRLYAHRLQA